MLIGSVLRFGGGRDGTVIFKTISCRRNKKRCVRIALWVSSVCAPLPRGLPASVPWQAVPCAHWSPSLEPWGPCEPPRGPGSIRKLRKKLQCSAVYQPS